MSIKIGTPRHWGKGSKNSASHNDEDMLYDENVDYDDLEQHAYSDTPDHVFYTCPLCGGEYLAAFITEENGKTMCIDCWNRRFGN